MNHSWINPKTLLVDACISLFELVLARYQALRLTNLVGTGWYRYQASFELWTNPYGSIMLHYTMNFSIIPTWACSLMVTILLRFIRIKISRASGWKRELQSQWSSQPPCFCRATCPWVPWWSEHVAIWFDLHVLRLADPIHQYETIWTNYN